MDDSPAGPSGYGTMGSKTPVSVYAPTGPYKGKTFDAAKEIGNGPGVLMFIHVVNREVAAMIRGLDTLGLEYGILGFKSFGIHLGLAANDQVARIEEQLGQKLAAPLLVPQRPAFDRLVGPPIPEKPSGLAAVRGPDATCLPTRCRA